MKNKLDKMLLLGSVELLGARSHENIGWRNVGWIPCSMMLIAVHIARYTSYLGYSLVLCQIFCLCAHARSNVAERRLWMHDVRCTSWIVERLNWHGCWRVAWGCDSGHECLVQRSERKKWRGSHDHILHLARAHDLEGMQASPDLIASTRRHFVRSKMFLACNGLSTSSKSPVAISVTSTTPVPRIPTELTDVIFNFLHDNEESLANCSLVEDWLHAARHHIVGELLLHPWNVEAFVNLITDPSATTSVMPHIHRLALDQITTRHTNLFNEMYPGLRGFDFVHRLELLNINCSNYEWLNFNGFITAFKNVTDLSIDGLVFDSPTVSSYLVAQFPSLHRLSVTTLTFSSNLSHLPPSFDFSDVVPNLRPQKIHNLVLNDADDHQTCILEWFSSCGTLVKSLSVVLGSLALPNIFEVLGPALLFLQIDMHFDLAGARSSRFLLTKFH